MLLRIPAFFYANIIRVRNLLYDAGLFRSRVAAAPVICIGNITAGGTGKTPLVVWLSKLLSAQDMKIAVLTRGYKTRRGAGSLRIDEPAVLAQSCPNLQVVVNPDRVAGAAEATGILGAEVLIMDDGFQHRRLARDLDIVTIDATDPFGSGRMLPAGLLREPPSSLRRAHAAVITRSDQAREQRLADIEKTLLARNPDLTIARASHAPVAAVSSTGRELGLNCLKGRKVLAFCGIGNPPAFFETIRRLGCDLVDTQAFDDHHHYSTDDITHIQTRAQKLDAELVLTTHKDWVSSPLSQAGDESMGELAVEFAFLNVEMRLITGCDELTALIEQVLAGKIHSL